MKSRIFLVAVSLSFAFAGWQFPASSRLSEEQQEQLRLDKGDVLVTHSKDGPVEFVAGRIRIHHPADQVWPVLANPYEFEKHISPRFHMVNVVTDKPDFTVLDCCVEIGLFFLPNIKYTVESHYESQRRITFRSTQGTLKDFSGYWRLQPVAEGKECDVVYSLHVDPGFPVPQWIVRQGIKYELPHTLSGLRTRVDAIYDHKKTPVPRTLVCAGKST